MIWRLKKSGCHIRCEQTTRKDEGWEVGEL